MKIIVLTLPLNTNYGGILQAYALQTVLQRMGHEVILLERKKDIFQLKGFKNRLIRVITRIFFKQESLKFVVWGKVDAFKKKYINLFQIKEFERFVESVRPDAYVVGSDQVWRPFWKDNYIPDFFLEFAKNDKSSKKIAYAASFAVDEWEFSADETTRYAALIKLFNAVSVRESSGVELCRQYFDVNAVQMLDPTLLLDKNDYERLVRENSEKKSSGKLFSYMLDASDFKRDVVRVAENSLDAVSFSLSCELCSSITQLFFSRSRYQIPSVTTWLKAYMDADYVVTDSFHGCVFSIIFNRPFWVIGNAGRGMARFTSLLKMFGLEDRMLSPKVDIDTFDFSKPIDWTSVNRIKKGWQEKSLEFLVTNLSNT